MPGNLVPAQMYDHSCVIVKSVDRLYVTDYAAKPAAGQTFDNGALVSLNSHGQFIVGLPRGQTAMRPMPFIAIQGTKNFSANSDVNNVSGGVNSAYVCSAGFEIESTEYSGATFHPNDLLTGSLASPGKIAAAGVSPYKAVPMCGVVSKGLNKNHDGVSVLRFWTVFLPAGTNGSSSSSSSSRSLSSRSLSSSPSASRSSAFLSSSSQSYSSSSRSRSLSHSSSSSH